MSAPTPLKGPAHPLRCPKPPNHNSRVHYVGARPYCGDMPPIECEQLHYNRHTGQQAS
jgi:hypothetical protein